MFDRFQLFTRAESLGGVESLVCHPASMTHASVPREARLAMGFADGLLRLSVGIEDVDDLRADLAAGAAKQIMTIGYALSCAPSRRRFELTHARPAPSFSALWVQYGLAR